MIGLVSRFRFSQCRFKGLLKPHELQLPEVSPASTYSGATTALILSSSPEHALVSAREMY